MADGGWRGGVLALACAVAVLAGACAGPGPSELATGPDGARPTAELAEGEGGAGSDTAPVPAPEPATAVPMSEVPAPKAVLPTSPDGAPVVSRIETDDPVIFLTVDDGHSAGDTAMGALELLRETGMPISMFLNEDPVREDAEYFQALIDMGHHVHSHTRDHLLLTRLDEAAQHDQVCGMVEVLQETFGQAGTLFRAPYGESDEVTQRVAAACGLRAIMFWTGLAEHQRVTLQGSALRPGDILLLHFGPELEADLVAAQAAADAAGLTIARLEDYTGP